MGIDHDEVLLLLSVEQAGRFRSLAAFSAASDG
jgi:hypothetical protein